MNEGGGLAILADGASVSKLCGFVLANAPATALGGGGTTTSHSALLAAPAPKKGKTPRSKKSKSPTKTSGAPALGEDAFQQTINAWSAAAAGGTASSTTAKKSSSTENKKKKGKHIVEDDIFVCDPVEQQPPSSAMKNKNSAVATTTATSTAPAGKPKQLGFEDLESFDYYLTRKYVGKKRGILTTHVGSLPRSFGSTSYDHVFQQIDIGIDIINDGEVDFIVLTMPTSICWNRGRTFFVAVQ